jgi:hypothetical protein
MKQSQFVGWVKAAQALQINRAFDLPQLTMGAYGGLRRVNAVPEAATVGPP